MGSMVSQITSLAIVYSAVYQRRHQSSASPAFVRGIHRGPVNSPHKWPVTWKMFPFDDVIMKIWTRRMIYILYMARLCRSGMCNFAAISCLKFRLEQKISLEYQLLVESWTSLYEIRNVFEPFDHSDTGIFQEVWNGRIPFSHHYRGCDYLIHDGSKVEPRVPSSYEWVGVQRTHSFENKGSKWDHKESIHFFY